MPSSRSLQATQPQTGAAARLAGWLWGGAIVGGIAALNYHNYLLFHSVAEFFVIIVACGIFVVAWHCRQWMEETFLVYVGIGYLFVAFVRLLHILSYKGMGVFPEATANLPTQLWIISRYLESLTLLLAFPLSRWRVSFTAALCGGALLVGGLLLTIHLGLFPDCYVEGASPPLTLFKRTSEYLNGFLLLATLGLLLCRRQFFSPWVRRLLVGAIGLSVLAGLAFTFYVHVYGVSNLVGHLASILSFYLVYKAVLETGLVQPHELFYRNLKHSEEQLRISNVQLADRTRDLEFFALHVAHDLKTPLAAVQGFTQLAAAELSPRHAAQPYLQSAQEATGRMNRLINELLQLAQLGKRPLSVMPLDLAVLARETVAGLRAGDPQRCVTISLPEQLPVEGDEELLRLVLDNLLSNAWKFSRQSDRPTITLEGYPEGTWVRVEVRDNGLGFDEAAAAQLFRPFVRLHRQEGLSGHGLGLASVRKAVELHGGHVQAQGRSGEGACISFYLPRKPASSAGNKATVEPVPSLRLSDDPAPT